MRCELERPHLILMPVTWTIPARRGRHTGVFRAEIKSSSAGRRQHPRLLASSRLKPFGPRARPARRGPLRKDWERGCGRHVCLIAPRRIGLGLRAEPPLGPSIQQHNSRRARSRPWPLQPTHRNDTKHDLPRRITRNARGSARYGGRPRGNRHRGSMSRILGRIGPEGRSSRRI
jgi:hypothetical protein